MFWKEKLPRLLSPPPNGRAVHFSTFFFFFFLKKDIKLNELKKIIIIKKNGQEVFSCYFRVRSLCVRAAIERRNAELCKQFADFFFFFK